MKEAITHAENKEFSKFSDKVRNSLEDKLKNHPVIKAKSDEMNVIIKSKELYSQISDQEDVGTEE